MDDEPLQPEPMAVTPDQPPGFLAAILANPADDTPRLVYADWLEENAGTEECTRCKGRGAVGWDYVNGVGQPPKVYECPECTAPGYVAKSDGRAERAEFIRVQCELAGWHPQTLALNIGLDALRQRERELWGEVWKEFGELPGLRSAHPSFVSDIMVYDLEIPRLEYHVSRGFVSHVCCTLETLFGGQCATCEGVAIAEQLTGHTVRPCPSAPHGIAARLFGCQPVTGVTLTDKGPNEIGEGWSWFRWVGLDDTDTLPSDLFDKLPDEESVPSMQGGRLTYPTRKAALSALSLAAVNLGRSLAAGRTHEGECPKCKGTKWKPNPATVNPISAKVRCNCINGRVTLAGLAPLQFPV